MSAGAAGRLLLAPVRAYRKYLSPLKPAPSCRFHPTCSEYAIEAVETHGAVKGALLATWRVLRCHPFSRGGHDPVPPRGTTPARNRREDPGEVRTARTEAR